MSTDGILAIDLTEEGWIDRVADHSAELLKSQPTQVELLAGGAAAPNLPELQFLAALHTHAEDRGIELTLRDASEEFEASMAGLGLPDLLDRTEG